LSISVDHLQKDFDYVILNQLRKRNQASNRFTEHHFESYLHESSAEKSIMIHEKIVSKDKQLIASIKAEFSSRSMREVRRESVISTDEIEDEFDAASTSYHIQNLDQLKY
jgi:hypothetical protein